MPSDIQYLIHTRLTRRDHHGDVVNVTSRDNVAFAVTSWRQEHPDVHVGEMTVIAEGLDAYTEIPVATAALDQGIRAPTTATANSPAAKLSIVLPPSGPISAYPSDHRSPSAAAPSRPSPAPCGCQ